jgi:hypothetical protein
MRGGRLESASLLAAEIEARRMVGRSAAETCQIRIIGRAFSWWSPTSLALGEKFGSD